MGEGAVVPLFRMSDAIVRALLMTMACAVSSVCFEMLITASR